MARKSAADRRFNAAMRQVLSVSKTEIDRRMAAAKAYRRATRETPGPKPKKRRARE